MSDTDSFIEEVSEEVRRDRLFKLMRKWGWIPVLLVLIIVGGAAYNEWSKATARSNAQNLGTEILSAIQLPEVADRTAAYGTIEVEGDNTVLLALLEASDALEEGDNARAISTLRNVAGDVALSNSYRHLAELKLIMLEADDLSTDDRMARLEAIATPGAPYRLLAEEQMAISEISSGNTDAALSRLQGIIADGEVTAGLRRRVSQLIVALGGELNPA